MSEAFRVTEYVDRSVESVWAALTSWKRAPEWMNGIEEMRAAGDGPVGEGSRLVFRARGVERESTIVAWSPPRRMVLRSQQGGMTATYEYTCEPEGEGTRLGLHARCDAHGFGWRLMAPLIRFLIKRTDSGQLSALKTVLEGPGS